MGWLTATTPVWVTLTVTVVALVIGLASAAWIGWRMGGHH